jgi:hypothetical protein
VDDCGGVGGRLVCQHPNSNSSVNPQSPAPTGTAPAAAADRAGEWWLTVSGTSARASPPDWRVPSRKLAPVMPRPSLLPGVEHRAGLWFVLTGLWRIVRGLGD